MAVGNLITIRSETDESTYSRRMQSMSISSVCINTCHITAVDNNILYSCRSGIAEKAQIRIGIIDIHI